MCQKWGVLCTHFKENVTLNQKCHMFSEWRCFQFIAHQPWRMLVSSFTSATHRLRLLTYILGLFWVVIGPGFVHNNKIELHFSQTMDILVENLKSWSHLELFLLPLRSAIECLWLSVGVTLYHLNVKTSPFL